VRHRGTLAASLLLSAGVVAAAISAPALATTHHSAMHPQGTKIGSRATTKYGRVVANAKGRVMYMHTTDKGTVSKCSGPCAAAWPKVTSKGKPVAGKDISAKHLKRNSKGQVTYYGHPLYYFVSDKRPGKISGEGLVHFFVVSTKGAAIKKPIKKTKPTAGPSGPAEVTTGMVGKTEVITSKNGHTLYALDPNELPGWSCTSSCTSVWIPLLTKGAPTAAGDAMPGELGTAKRPNGSTQVTYGGMPVYDYAPDTAAGQDKGQLAPGPYLNYWYDITPDGSVNL
jgi:predicted lipoprotein with Yx(FWY)xxD motif